MHHREHRRRHLRHLLVHRHLGAHRPLRIAALKEVHMKRDGRKERRRVSQRKILVQTLKGRIRMRRPERPSS
eukprot:5515198-Karenia_brevis.AAC.1